MIFRKMCCVVLALIICLSCSAEPKNEKADIFIEGAVNNKTFNHKITVELAITPEQQARGFMERKNIPQGTGMIFLYKEDTQLKFWMKNTPHPLSIAFIDSAGIIREIYDMMPYSLQITSSTHSVRYALEVPQGMFTGMGIKAGCSLSKESILLLKRKAVELTP